MFFNQITPKLSIVRIGNWVKVVNNKSEEYVRILDMVGEFLKVETIDRQIFLKAINEVVVVPITNEILLNIGCSETIAWKKDIDDHNSYVIRYWPCPKYYYNENENPPQNIKVVLTKNWSAFVELNTLHQFQNLC